MSLENAGLWRGERQEEAPRLASFSPLHKLFFLFLPLKIRSVSLLHSTVLEWPGRKSFPKFVSFSLGGNASLDLMWGFIPLETHMPRFLPRNIHVRDYRVLPRPPDLLRVLFNVQNIDCSTF